MPPEHNTTTSELARIMSEGVHGNDEQFERLKKIFELLTEAVVITDSHGVVLYANSAIEHMTGYSGAEILGQTPALWGKQMDEAFYQGLWQTIAEQKVQYRGEVRNRRKDGSSYDAEVHIAPILDAEGNVQFYIGVERNITETKQIQRSKREFISLASHNLKTPLASIRWYAEMLHDGDVGRLSKGQKEYVDEIQTGVKRMVRLIDQWLTISRIDLGLYTFHNEILDLRDMVNEVLAEVKDRAASKSINLQYMSAPTTCGIVSDREVIHTIVRTLILNAVKYTNANGTVDVGELRVPAGSMHAGKTFTDDRIVLSVRDTGIGIPEEEQGQIFQQFFRASNVEVMQTQGAGLGLFLSRSLVSMMSGDIWFTSSPQGSEFHVALPTSGTNADSPEQHS